MKTERRSALKKMFSAIAGLTGIGLAAKGYASSPHEKDAGNITGYQDVPLYSGHTICGNLVFISGKAARVAPFEIRAHTEIVLKQLEDELKQAGSSMQKVMKVNVYLNDITDYQGMNEIYKGRFGDKPPVRTTVAVAKGGIPFGSLVEMDCIACI